MTVIAQWLDPTAPPPDIRDVEQAVHNLVNGRDLDGHQYTDEDLDRRRYPTDPTMPVWTLRECLSETAAELVQFFELDRRRIPQPGQHRCDACGRPVTLPGFCDPCHDDDARTHGAVQPLVPPSGTPA